MMSIYSCARWFCRQTLSHDKYKLLFVESFCNLGKKAAFLFKPGNSNVAISSIASMDGNFNVTTCTLSEKFRFSRNVFVFVFLNFAHIKERSWV